MKSKSKKKQIKTSNSNDNWLYNPSVVKNILHAKSEAEKDFTSGKTFSLDEVLEEFRLEDEKGI